MLLAVYSIYSGIQANTKATKLEKQVAKQETKLADLQEIGKIDTPETDSFLKRFLSVYFSIDEKADGQKERESKLAEFNSQLDYKLPTVPKVGQEIYATRNLGYEAVGDHFVATYTVETRTIEKKSQSFVSNVLIPFKKEKDGYLVIALPYQQEYNPKDLVSNKKDSLKSIGGKELEDKKATEKLKTFAEQFLTEYQNNNKENLKYLMQDVEGLAGNKVVKLKDIHYYGTEKAPIVEVSIQVENKHTDISFAEQMRLHLSINDEGKYFIDKLEHF